MHEIALADVDATEALGRRVAALLRAEDTVLLHGPLGAGKTSFSRGLLRGALNDPALDVPSPSYTLLQSYETPAFTIHHFDLWRLDGPDALIELGWDDARRGVALVEWPDRLEDLTPPDALSITLRYEGERRIAAIAGWNDRWR